MRLCTLVLAATVLCTICRAIATLYCSTAFECESQDLEIYSHLYCEGYKSNYGTLSQMDATEQVYCSGASSCIEANSISAGYYIFCRGSLSCANVNDLNLKDGTAGYVHVSAEGVASMTSATISASDRDINCDGEQSCAYSIISQFTLLYARGAYSLLNATIEATNTTDIYLRGHYAAFGATLICNKSQSQCNINCYSNGCINFNLFCGSNQCNIIGNNNTFSPLSIHDLWHYDALIMTQQNDDACSLQMDNMTFDDSKERYAINTTLDNIYGVICCRGQDSCRSNIIHYISAAASSDKSIVCSGSEACRDSDIIVLDGAVYCGGHASCSSSSRITAAIVYCYGSAACRYSHINHTSSIYCSAERSCFGSFIRSDGVDLNLYLLGYASGYNAVVKCSDSDHCSIFCSGHYACWGMILECVGICIVHHCDEYSSCPNVFNLTGNPTTDSSLSPSELTTGPSASPTKQPSGSPTKKTSASPTIDTNPPSASPTKGPTAAPTNDTNPPNASTSNQTTAAPSKTHVMMITNYTISIEIESCPNDECRVNEVQIEELLSAIYDVQILSTNVLEKQTVFVVSITTQEYNQISGDIIGDALEAELRRDGDDVTVSVSVKETRGSNDDDKSDKTKTFAFFGYSFNAPATIGIIVAFVFLIIIALFCVYYICVQHKGKQKVIKQQEILHIEMKQNAVDAVNNNANNDEHTAGAPQQPGSIELVPDIERQHVNDGEDSDIFVNGEHEPSSDGNEITEKTQEYHENVHQNEIAPEETQGKKTARNPNIAEDEFVVEADGEIVTKNEET